MSAKRNDIVNFCQEYLKVNDFQDYCHNGLQVQGVENISSIVTGVTLSKQLIQAAIDKKAQMLMVHHGIFGDQIDKPPVIKGYIKDRLKALLSNEINLCGFHLPLDAHPQIGNNISLCKLLRVKNTDPFDVGYIGTLSKPMNFKQLVGLVEKTLDTKAFVISAGKEQVRSVAIVSGGSSPDAMEAAAQGADVFIGGDIRESVVRAVEEVGINFINAGHYNTEKLGIQNLGALVAKNFKVKVEFVDVPCDV